MHGWSRPVLDHRFDFLGLGEEALEREIELALTRHITQFLLELGAGFAFVDRHGMTRYRLFFGIHLLPPAALVRFCSSIRIAPWLSPLPRCQSTENQVRCNSSAGRSPSSPWWTRA